MTNDRTGMTTPSSRLREAQTGTQVSPPQPISPLQFWVKFVGTYESPLAEVS